MTGSIHPISDEGRRISEAHDNARALGGVGRWLSIRLADGKAEGDPLDIYDSFADAARHWDDYTHAFLCVNHMQMPPAEGTHWLGLQRRLASSGFKLTDPGTPQAIPPLMPPAQHQQAGPSMTVGGIALDPAFAALLKPHLVPMNRAERRRRARDN